MKTLTSFIFVAALLPVVIFGAVMKDRLFLTASADTTPIVRVWFEPANVVLSPGSHARVRVMAESEATRKLVGGLTLNLQATDNLNVTPAVITFSDAFLGRTQIGTVEVGGNSGELDVDLTTSAVLPPEFNLQISKLTVTAE